MISSDYTVFISCIKITEAKFAGTFLEYNVQDKNLENIRDSLRRAHGNIWRNGTDNVFLISGTEIKFIK